MLVFWVLSDIFFSLFEGERKKRGKGGKRCNSGGEKMVWKKNEAEKKMRQCAAGGKYKK